ncbi:LexA family transcriptional regulator [Vagococcus intermedius]|uniref:XRE family transcriptional regulator n=1 Tax=Vagococcus intermedius TaxID=2991418 RepID=A0AAF0I8Q5_9ENTE|nr:XRE family transcriptional regulator [Vagococcus intermedius]WEG74384.1 XRE family transcriptional regulator [Vagococcus intermedius]WEG76506.1 XRE family transcriptional regulator [Vagococcus intermedius]
MESKTQNKIIADNIKKYLKQNKMSQKDLASKVNISPSTMSDYMNLRSKPSHGVIQRISEVFGVNKSDIDTTYKDVKEIKSNILSVYNQLNETNQKDVYQYAESKLEEQNNNVIDLRTYRDVYLQSKLSAGTGIVDLDPQHKEIISYAGHIPDKYDLAFEVSGDSMEPLFEDGEVVFVKCDDDVRNGQIGVVMIGSDAYVKKMYVEDGQIRLVSLNKNYDDIIATSDIKVIGRIIM